MWRTVELRCFSFLLAMLLQVSVESKESDYFIRSPKWQNLSPFGGSLVSGRGNFRPGFVSRAADTLQYLTDPLLMIKRSDLESR
ncbi:hypothetical protein AB6A40_003531 [Gnathostoma spinigerum]|uniref:Uncharacterized protein n=1 Tax=Gnathostoma spinigerum TaxID=75299 RepID=A0ABD6EJT5_9BILA